MISNRFFSGEPGEKFPFFAALKTRLICLVATFLFIVFLDLFIASPIHLSYSGYMPDNLLGWTPKRDFSRELTEKDAAGNTYKVLFSLDHNGFRAYGDPATKRLKILFLGDSYTGDPKASNERMYFSVVKSTLRDKFGLDVEVFTAGGGGYGTLQEYLFIKEYISIIKPDICVLQFTDNDFTNNFQEWEKYSIVRNQKYLRPYYSLESDSVYYVGTIWAKTYRLLYNRSFLFRGVDALARRIQYRYYSDRYKKNPSNYYDGYSALPLAETYALLRQSYQVSKKLLLLFKKDFSPSTRFFTFFPPAGIDQNFLEQWVALAEECGFTPLLSPIRALNKATVEGEVVLNADGGHYNNLGNLIMGEALAEELAAQL
jgi:lysophospholipase L1-like esterase